jgi:hypothetical protein
VVSLSLNVTETLAFQSIIKKFVNELINLERAVHGDLDGDKILICEGMTNLTLPQASHPRG